MEPIPTGTPNNSADFPLQHQRIAIVVFVLILAGWTQFSLAAEPTDRFRFRQASGGEIVIPCFITDYNVSEIRYRLKDDGPIQTKPADQVTEVETPLSAPHIKGLREFAARKISEANEQFRAALAQEPRAWVRRDILAMLVRCAFHQRDYASAGNRFLTIVRSESNTRHIALAPLLWTQADVSNDLRSEALTWKLRNDTVAQILSASVLLLDAEHGPAARTQMSRLADSAEEPWRQVAKMQLWRLAIQRNQVSSSDLNIWAADIRFLREELRGGPWYTLGDAYRLKKQHGQAAAAYLWVPLVYGENVHLAALAMQNASESLRAIGRVADADTLEREIISRYPSSEAAIKLQAAIKNQSNSNSPP